MVGGLLVSRQRGGSLLSSQWGRDLTTELAGKAGSTSWLTWKAGRRGRSPTASLLEQGACLAHGLENRAGEDLTDWIRELGRGKFSWGKWRTVQQLEMGLLEGFLKAGERLGSFEKPRPAGWLGGEADKNPGRKDRAAGCSSVGCG